MAGTRHRTRAAFAAAVVAVFVLGGLAAWQAQGYGEWSRARGGRLLPGTSVSGRRLGGMTVAAARAAVLSRAEALAATLTVSAGEATYAVPAAELGTSSDAAAVAGRLPALAYVPSYGDYLAWQLGRDPYRSHPGTALVLRFSTDASATAAAARRVAGEASRKAKDDTLACSRGGRLSVVPGRAGLSVDATALAGQLAAAAGAENASLAAATRDVPPAAVAGRAIVVDQSRRTVTLYDATTLAVVRRYRCAVGQRAWPTPNGDFHVVSKRKNAPWINPHSAWSAGMPDVIGPGPSNPMGVRKIGIDYPGVYLHGIPRSEFGSIGTAASHGCMRMLPKDVADLYGRVRIGTPVFIRP